MTQPTLAIIGGTGLQGMEGLQSLREETLDTPYGPPSSPVLFGDLDGIEIAFLARHGIGHNITPSEVNYRANIFALKTLGAEKILAVSACGSLREDYAPGEMVIPDQLYDNTKGRARTFFGEGIVGHISSADPFCPDMRQSLIDSVVEPDGIAHDGGSYITIEGPRFSTRAESNTFRAWGMSIIGMTTSPEAYLAREAEMCYAVLAHVTDYDVWHLSEEPVSVEMVVRTLKQNTQKAEQTIKAFLPKLLEPSTCSCRDALQDALITEMRLVPEETLSKLHPILAKYLDDQSQP